MIKVNCYNLQVNSNNKQMIFITDKFNGVFVDMVQVLVVAVVHHHQQPQLAVIMLHHQQQLHQDYQQQHQIMFLIQYH